MAARYPFLDIRPRCSEASGHAASIRRIWAATDTTLLFHTEDDWVFTTDFRLGELIDELGDDDQCILRRHAPDFDWRFNPRHRQLTGPYRDWVEAAGHATEPRTAEGWWWQGFSLNPSLLRLDRARALAGVGVWLTVRIDGQTCRLALSDAELQRWLDVGYRPA